MKNSLKIASPQMQTIQACARANKIAVSMGFAENDNNSLYIAQLLLGPDGAILVHRRKMKPTHMERTVFGDASGHCFTSVASLPLMEGDDPVRVGALSCWEHIQPLLKFATLSQGEDIHVAAWPSLTPHSGDGPDMWSMSNEGCMSLSRTYAIEASCFVLHCTAVISDKCVQANGSAAGVLFSAPGGGSSAIFGPDGRLLTQLLGETEEGIIYANLDFDAIMRAKMFADCTGHYSRPDLMFLTVQRQLKSVVRTIEGQDAKLDEVTAGATN
ncbi:carbon-nitrogen hydrolase [Gymnopus androsaceus JB14]|uniref:Carbon-nitrogen hydrolase n=1 Tax=Gymnopus androsaceus JB14 TaxID=1447944 RepID=A0A6A4IRN3_9AGAR|nr:carbon-nitrogen hydrolase [Gymnopus androsaceus JB14]